jgi:ribulose bisphosphate carboxylase small subunit
MPFKLAKNIRITKEYKTERSFHTLFWNRGKSKGTEILTTDENTCGLKGSLSPH